MMNERIQELIATLQLEAHPEGGYFKETYRSELSLDEPKRQLMTSIYFLLTGDNCSRFHRIKSDETWYFHEGNSLLVHELIDGDYRVTPLGLDLANGEQPFTVVKAGSIFGSSVKNNSGYALVSCAVAPGFDFEDFELFDTATLLEQFPHHEAIIRQLT